MKMVRKKVVTGIFSNIGENESDYLVCGELKAWSRSCATADTYKRMKIVARLIFSSLGEHGNGYLVDKVDLAQQ